MERERSEMKAELAEMGVTEAMIQKIRIESVSTLRKVRQAFRLKFQKMMTQVLKTA